MSRTSPLPCPSRAESSRGSKLAWLSLVVSLLACSPSPKRYDTRGVVTAQSGIGAATRYAVHHEALPAFLDRDGKPAPMESMTMMFGLAEGVTPLDLAPGAKVTLGFEVHWESGEALRITRLAPLPDDTALDLREHAHHARSRDAGVDASR